MGKKKLLTGTVLPDLPSFHHTLPSPPSPLRNLGKWAIVGNGEAEVRWGQVGRGEVELVTLLAQIDPYVAEVKLGKEGRRDEWEESEGRGIQISTYIHTTTHCMIFCSFSYFIPRFSVSGRAKLTSFTSCHVYSIRSEYRRNLWNFSCHLIILSTKYIKSLHILCINRSVQGRSVVFVLCVHGTVCD